MLKSAAVVIAFAGLLGSTAGVLGQDASAASPAPQAAPATLPPGVNDPNQIVCRTMAPPTGTRLGGRRICQTQRQWDDEMNQAQQHLQKIQSVPWIPPGGV